MSSPELVEFMLLAVRIKGRLHPIVTGRGSAVQLGYVSWMGRPLPSAADVLKRALIEEEDAVASGALEDFGDSSCVFIVSEKHRGDKTENHRGPQKHRGCDDDFYEIVEINEKTQLGFLPFVLQKEGRHKWLEIFTPEELEELETEMLGAVSGALNLIVLAGPCDGFTDGIKVYRTCWKVKGGVNG